MAQFKVVYNAATKTAQVLDSATATPGGTVSWGTFYHDHDGGADTEVNDGLDNRDTHALYHHVRDLAYKAGYLDMSIITITLGSGVTIQPPT